VAPAVSWLFTLGAGTGHVFYPLLPVIHDVAHENGIRPERPITISTIASQQACTASPVSAATAAMIALMEPVGVSMGKIIAIAIPATLIGVIVGALVMTRIGKELADDPEYQRRLKAGEIAPPRKGEAKGPAKELPASARTSALLFLLGVVLVVAAGLFPALRPSFLKAGKMATLDMATTIQIVMLGMAALLLAVTKVPAGNIPKTASLQAGVTAVVGIFGLAWLGDTFIKANEKLIIGMIGDMTAQYPVVFTLGLFFASVLLFSQAATTRALMPLGISLGLPPATLVSSWPAVNGYFFLPTYGTLIAAINFDRTGTTRIGRFVLNHSFMLPGLISTITTVAVGFVIAKFLL
jgi:anaerobic C4-dicarboxylate transporter DcuA